MKYFFGLLIFLFLFPTNAFAQEGWTIESFDSEITILENGEVSIVETIEVDFGTLEKHGIFRNIPYIYEKEDGSEYYTELKVNSVNKQ